MLSVAVLSCSGAGGKRASKATTSVRSNELEVEVLWPSVASDVDEFRAC